MLSLWSVVVSGVLREVCSAKVRRLGENVGQAWRLHVHREDAFEIQDIRELGLGWALYVNDRRVFLSAWQDMELASPFPEEPVTQIKADVSLEPLSLQAENADLELDLCSYERPRAVSPFRTLENVPDWVDTHTRPQSRLGKWTGVKKMWIHT